jgi:hypothetical protein
MSLQLRKIGAGLPAILGGILKNKSADNGKYGGKNQN